MAAPIATPGDSALPAERFFRTSLSLLVLTSTVTLVSTGKLDIVTSFAAPLVVLFKGMRWWHGRPAELSHRAATWCVAAYLAFFPVDALLLSRLSVGNSSNPPLFAALLAAVHFLIFFFPRISAGYLGRASFNTSLMSGFTENVELGQIGEIKKNSAVVMRVQTGKPISYERLRWRGIALTTFDGRRWSSSEHNPEKLQPKEDGWIYTAEIPKPPKPGMFYTLYLEPLATDAIIVPGKVTRLRGNFTGESNNAFGAIRRNYIFRDSTDTLLNRFHNYTAIRYAGSSLLPAMDAAKLRAAPTEYSSNIISTYLQ